MSAVVLALQNARQQLDRVCASQHRFVDRGHRSRHPRFCVQHSRDSAMDSTECKERGQDTGLAVVVFGVSYRLGRLPVARRTLADVAIVQVLLLPVILVLTASTIQGPNEYM